MYLILTHNSFKVSDVDLIHYVDEFLPIESLKTIRTLNFSWAVQGYPPPCPPKTKPVSERFNKVRRNETKGTATGIRTGMLSGRTLQTWMDCRICGSKSALIKTM